MRLSLAVAALAAAISHAFADSAPALPSPSGLEHLGGVEVPGQPGIYSFNNITSMDHVHGLMRRQSVNWCAIWYGGLRNGACELPFINLWCGTGPSGCIVLPENQSPDGGKSVNWQPGTSGLTLHAYTNENCRPCCGDQKGPDRSGCLGFRANVWSSGVSSFFVA